MDKFSPVDIALTSGMSNETLKDRSLIDSESIFGNSDRGGSEGVAYFCVIAWHPIASSTNRYVSKSYLFTYKLTLSSMTVHIDFSEMLLFFCGAIIMNSSIVHMESVVRME
jgi:hypothetical protein